MNLFFYGVLLESVACWPFLHGLGPGQVATISGRLFAVEDADGWYPALIPGAGTVHGAVHALGSADLAAIDRFEGYCPETPDRGDYRRVPVAALLGDGMVVPAQAYVWNRATDALAPISGGNFPEWLARTGQRGFGASR